MAAPNNPPKDILTVAAPSQMATSSVSKIELLSVEFLNDHGVLTDNTQTWDGSGNLYPVPEWQFKKPASIESPVSCTKNTKVELEVRLRVTTTGAAVMGKLVGVVANASLKFESSNVSFANGVVVPVKVTSDKKLPDKILLIEFDVAWTVVIDKKVPPVVPSPDQSKNTMFVIYDAPTTPPEGKAPGKDKRPARPGITEHRMRHAVAQTATATRKSIEPHALAKSLLNSLPYNNQENYANEWQFADNLSLGATCYTISRYLEAVLDMVGIPGDKEIVVVWASTSDPKKPIVNPSELPNMTSNPAGSGNKGLAFLLEGNVNVGDDGSSLANKYEACMRYNHGGKEYFYAGGMGRYRTALKVLNCFAEMSYLSNGTKTETIQTYPGRANVAED